MITLYSTTAEDLCVLPGPDVKKVYKENIRLSRTSPFLHTDN